MLEITPILNINMTNFYTTNSAQLPAFTNCTDPGNRLQKGLFDG